MEYSLPSIKFSYNDNYHVNIKATPFETLYKCKRHTWYVEKWLEVQNWTKHMHMICCILIQEALIRLQKRLWEHNTDYRLYSNDKKVM